MQIAVDARFLGSANSGVARYSENLLVAMSRIDRANQYTVFVHHRLKRKLKLGENFTIVRVKGHPLSIRSMWQLSRMVRPEAFDLLHVLFPYVSIRARCPVMLTVHDTLPFSREQIGFGPKRGPQSWLRRYVLYPLALRRAKWIICVSRATRDALAELFPETFHRTLVVHSGVNEDFRQAAEEATLELIRSRLNLPPRYLLYSGSARSDKNIEGMLRAFARLRQLNDSMDDLHFLMDIQGHEYPLKPIMNRIAQYGLEGRVRIIQDIGDEERVVLFQHAAAFLILSRTEGFGIPILEAQMCGVPVVAADAMALPEVAGEQGALYVDPDDLDETVRLLGLALTDDGLREYLIAEGRKNANRFSWAKAAEQIVQIYEFGFYPRHQVELPHRRPWLTRLADALRI
ncbi:MAG TPA: glycosyltransferase family 1 protein [Candidatus Sumerlaeota bacterium]|nr:glycosyltransferase family 1 protein [Candidatus Sumerlaeota bacterium]